LQPTLLLLLQFLIKFTNNEILNTEEFQNKSKAVLAYTLNNCLFQHILPRLTAAHNKLIQEIHVLKVEVILHLLPVLDRNHI